MTGIINDARKRKVTTAGNKVNVVVIFPESGLANVPE
tara:strand:+ start:22360 stop:22470 length:111 start_codon:yes stop_codon:yes gene_type:complete